MLKMLKVLVRETAHVTIRYLKGPGSIEWNKVDLVSEKAKQKQICALCRTTIRCGQNRETSGTDLTSSSLNVISCSNRLNLSKWSEWQWESESIAWEGRKSAQHPYQRGLAYSPWSQKNETYHHYNILHPLHNTCLNPTTVPSEVRPEFALPRQLPHPMQGLTSGHDISDFRTDLSGLCFGYKPLLTADSQDSQCARQLHKRYAKFLYSKLQNICTCRRPQAR